MAIDKGKTATARAAEKRREELNQPADIGAAAASDFEASGAVVESGALAEIDADHASVDNNPRSDTTKTMNQIDFNEPSALTPPEEQVEEELRETGSDGAGAAAKK